MTDNQMLLQSMDDNTIWIVAIIIISLGLLIHYLSNKSIPRIVLKERTFLKLIITVPKLSRACTVVQVWCNSREEEISSSLTYSLYKEEVIELCEEEEVDFMVGKIVIKQSF